LTLASSLENQIHAGVGGRPGIWCSASTGVSRVSASAWSASSMALWLLDVLPGGLRRQFRCLHGGSPTLCQEVPDRAHRRPGPWVSDRGGRSEANGGGGSCRSEETAGGAPARSEAVAKLPNCGLAMVRRVAKEGACAKGSGDAVGFRSAGGAIDSLASSGDCAGSIHGILGGLKTDSTRFAGDVGNLRHRAALFIGFEPRPGAHQQPVEFRGLSALSNCLGSHLRRRIYAGIISECFIE
jgi:hypothetical protein